VLDARAMDRFDKAGESFARLCRIMARLRAPGGCPWDREQTPASLKPYLIEEAYETIDAIDSGDRQALREELGDLLLQVVFHAELSQEGGSFDMAEVATGISDKLVRRHPHVFGGETADGSNGALRNWEAVKATERPKNKGTLDSIPRGLPALLRAMRSGEKAGAVGFDWSAPADVVTKVDEELGELREAMHAGDASAITEELGDLLFALVNLSRRLGVDAESALHRATDKFQSRFAFMERELRAQSRTPRDASMPELDGLWEAAKKAERTGP
jgi:tetrapyrrole methylase family protein/MazG family protein